MENALLAIGNLEVERGELAVRAKNGLEQHANTAEKGGGMLSVKVIPPLKIKQHVGLHPAEIF